MFLENRASLSTLPTYLATYSIIVFDAHMTAVHVQATEDVSRFLEDVIGKGQVLTPSSGKLRQIHARIGKEVTDAKVRYSQDGSERVLCRG